MTFKKPLGTDHSGGVTSTTTGHATGSAVKRRDRSVLVSFTIVFIVGFVIAAIYGLVIYPHQNAIDPAIDLNGFGGIGRHLAAGEGFSIADDPTIRRAPLYPGIIALILTVFGHEGPDQVVYRPVIVLNAVFAGLTCACAAGIGRGLFGNRIGFCSGILTAVLPQALRYVGMTEVETLMTLLIALMALTGLRLSRQQTIMNGVMFGLVCAAATLTKPVAEIYPLLFTLLLLLCERRRSSGVFPSFATVRSLVTAIAVFIVCLVPWTLRNAIISHGEFLGISSNAPGEFIRGYVNVLPKYAFLRVDFGGSDTTRVHWDREANDYEDDVLLPHGLSMYAPGPESRANQIRFRPTLAYELAKERIEREEVKRRVLHHPLAVLRKFVIQLGTFWYVVETRKKSVLIGLAAIFMLMGSVTGVVFAHRRRIDTWPIVAVVLYFQVVYAAVLSFARYSLPLFPILMPLFLFGVAESARLLSRRWNERRSGV